MVRTGALVLLVVTGALAVAGLALVEPSLTLDPTSGVPGSTFVVMPFLDESGPCQIEWGGTALASPTQCGPTAPDSSPVTLTAPDDPGPHTVTLCVPSCAAPKIHRDETFTVLSPTPTDTSPGGNVPPPVSVPDSASTTSTVRTATPRPTTVPSSLVAGPVAAGSRVPPALVAAGVVLVALLALGATLVLRRRQPVPRHAGPSGHAVAVSTSARRRVARAAPRRLDRGRVGVTSRRSRSARSQHEQRRQEGTS